MSDAAPGATLTVAALCVRLHPLDPGSVERWVGNAWVHPDGAPGAAPDAWRFRDIDVARVRLILELRDTLRVEEDTLPLVLSLLDQLYDARRALRRLHGAVRRAVPDEARARLREVLAEGPDEGLGGASPP